MNRQQQPDSSRRQRGAPLPRRVLARHVLSAGQPLPTDILVHDYLTVGGRKISKSSGVTIDPAALALLGANLKMVWSAPTTDARLKKRIVRTLIHEVVADIDDDASEIVIVVHWTGGVHSEIRLPKRRRGQRNSTSADIIAAVAQLALIASDDLIAGLLNRNGLTHQSVI